MLISLHHRCILLKFLVSMIHFGISRCTVIMKVEFDVFFAFKLFWANILLCYFAKWVKTFNTHTKHSSKMIFGDRIFEFLPITTDPVKTMFANRDLLLCSSCSFRCSVQNDSSLIMEGVNRSVKATIMHLCISFLLFGQSGDCMIRWRGRSIFIVVCEKLWLLSISNLLSDNDSSTNVLANRWFDWSKPKLF